MLSLESQDINIDDEYQLTTQNDNYDNDDDDNDDDDNDNNNNNLDDIPDENSIKTSSMRYSSLNARITKKREEKYQNFKLDVGDEFSSNNSNVRFQNPSRVAQYTKTFTSGNSLVKRGKFIEIGILKKTISNLRDEFNELTQDVNDLLSKKNVTEEEKQAEEFHKRMQVIELEKQRFKEGIKILTDKKQRIQHKFDKLEANDRIKEMPEYLYHIKLKKAIKKLANGQPKDRLFKLQINRQRQLSNEIKFIGSRYAGRTELAKQDIKNYIQTLEGRIVKNYR